MCFLLTRVHLTARNGGQNASMIKSHANPELNQNVGIGHVIVVTLLRLRLTKLEDSLGYFWALSMHLKCPSVKQLHFCWARNKINFLKRNLYKGSVFFEDDLFCF